MCGIVGVLSTVDDSALNEGLLRRMIGAIRHRGPDQFGVYLFASAALRLGLGNARLSILDLSCGQQPIGNEDHTLWIVFNGEVFNYLELRRDLEAQGHLFRTETDTEVILHLFEQYGPDCVRRLNGQFALAIWDEKARRLFLARDRCGILPLYYRLQDGDFIFASEIKAIAAHPRVSLDLDPLALDQIFTYWSPLSPRTAFRDIRSLPPGCCAVVDSDGTLRINRYWQPCFPDAHQEPLRDPEEAGHQFKSLLADATRLRLRADVTVGAYLSGGLDSSAVTAIARHITGDQLETFSVAFTDQAYDESEFQQRMATHLGTRHHIISCSPTDIGSVFPEVIWHTETPLLRTAPAPLFLLSQLVRREGIKVVLTGEGADEFLAGYNIFKEAKIRRFWSRTPESAWRPVLLQRLYAYVGDLSAVGNAYQRSFFGQGLNRSNSPTYSHEVRWRNTSRIKRLLSRRVQAEVDAQPCDEFEAGESDGLAAGPLQLPDGFSDWSGLSQAQYLEATVFLPEYLLCSQGDRMLMAHSVEGRFPFLDHRVIEFASLLAPRLKLCGLQEKYLLRRTMRAELPDAILNRPKQPYRAPIHACFFPNGSILEWVAEELSAAAVEAAGCFDSRAVSVLVEKASRSGSLSETDSMALVGAISTQLVYRQFVSGYRRSPTRERECDVKTVLRGDLMHDKVAGRCV